MGKQKNGRGKRVDKSILSPDTDDRTFEHFSPTETDIGNGVSLVDQLAAQTDKTKNQHAAKLEGSMDHHANQFDTPVPAKTEAKKVKGVPHKDGGNVSNAPKPDTVGKSGGKHKIHQSSYTYDSAPEIKQKLGKTKAAVDDEEFTGNNVKTGNIFALLAVEGGQDDE